MTAPRPFGASTSFSQVGEFVTSDEARQREVLRIDALRRLDVLASASRMSLIASLRTLVAAATARGRDERQGQSGDEQPRGGTSHRDSP